MWRVLASLVLTYSTNPQQQAARVLFGWGTILEQFNQFHKAIPLLREAVELLTPPEGREEADMYLSSIAMLGKVEQELGLLEEAEDLLLKGVAFRGAGLALGKASFRMLAMGWLDEALQYARDGEQEMLKVKHYDDQPPIQKEVLATLADINEAMGNDEEAFLYQERAFELVFQQEAKKGFPVLPFEDGSRFHRRLAKKMMREGRARDAEEALNPERGLGMYVEELKKGRLMHSKRHMLEFELRVLVDVWSALGKHEEAGRLTASLDEDGAIIAVYKRGILDELVVELWT